VPEVEEKGIHFWWHFLSHGHFFQIQNYFIPFLTVERLGPRASDETKDRETVSSRVFLPYRNSFHCFRDMKGVRVPRLMSHPPITKETDRHDINLNWSGHVSPSLVIFSFNRWTQFLMKRMELCLTNGWRDHKDTNEREREQSSQRPDTILKQENRIVSFAWADLSLSICNVGLSPGQLVTYSYRWSCKPMRICYRLGYQNLHGE